MKYFGRKFHARRFFIFAATFTFLLMVYQKQTAYINIARHFEIARQFDSIRYPSQKKVLDAVSSVHFGNESCLSYHIAIKNCRQYLETGIKPRTKLMLEKKIISQSLREANALALSRNCDLLQSRLCFPTAPNSEMERKFPLAFIILAYTEPDRLLKLFQSLYWPQNLFCLHIDASANESVHEMSRNIAKCFPDQTIVIQPSIDVEWAAYSHLQAEISCLNALESRNDHGWKYVSVLTGRDWPLRTNMEMVKVLKAMNGYSDVSMSHTRSYYNSRVPDKLKHKEPLTVFKSSGGATLSRQLVLEIAHNAKIKEFVDWLRNVKHPGEFYHGSVAFAPGVNGSIPYTIMDKLNGLKQRFLKEGKLSNEGAGLGFALRHHIWNHTQCGGRFHTLHGCELGIADLPQTIQQAPFVAHKFRSDFEPVAYECLREWYLNKSWNLHPEPLGWKFDIQMYNGLWPMLYQHFLSNSSGRS